MKTLRVPLCLLSLVLVATASSGARAQRAVPSGDEAVGFEGRWWALPVVQARLGISPQQSESIDAITYQSGERLIDLRAGLEKSRLELSRLLQADELDAAALDRAAERVAAAQAAIYREDTLTRASIAKLLSRRQRLTLMAMFERRTRLQRLRR